jgi:Protein of unknown function (DUF1592)/Protein of unknown function (DUF1588)/Protein of unknown function (DUF1587)/Protein of unknown function (DUF1595)/Protein of unknown function (DUF1585)
MRSTPALLSHRHELVMVGLLVLSACTGTSSLPPGTPGAKGTGTNPPSAGSGAGGSASTAGGTGATSGAGAAVSGGGNAVGIGAVAPSTQLDPGRVMLRRLNVAEYNNTVRDLLGTTTRPADKFTGDDVADGFDTLGEALSFSDVLGEDVENAATALATEVLARPATDPIRSKILVCTPTAANLATCLTQIMTTFMKNAYRRPVTPAEVASVVQLASAITTSSGDVNRGLNAAFTRVLLSPYFIFHVELGTPNSSAATNLNDYELASRLSYFLWSSMPDATLMQAADATMLSPAGAPYATQVDRLLADAKAQGLVDNFAGQWLWIREVSGVSPDPELFPTVDQALLDAIPQETGLFFKSLLTGAKPLSTLLLANYTFVNARLAKQYGLPGGGTAFAQVTLPATSNRMGILTQETFLTTTSQPNRTSPVKRGEWILEQLLCDPPPAPPPNVPTLPPIVTGSGLTGRAYLEEHIQNPYCASCHASIDPLGFTLENFDAVGSYRTLDNAQAIDPSGVMPDGAKFSGPTEIAQWIAKDPRFPRCMTKQMMTYAIGRSFDSTQALAYVAGAADPLASNGTWTQLVHTVATSQAFLTRRGEGP